MTKKIVVYKNDTKFFGYLIKSLGKNVVIVNVDGKEYVGRLVNSWVEI